MTSFQNIGLHNYRIHIYKLENILNQQTENRAKQDICL
jgi:hypothetical protein